MLLTIRSTRLRDWDSRYPILEDIWFFPFLTWLSLRSKGPSLFYTMMWVLRVLWLAVAHDLSEYRYMDDVTRNLIVCFVQHGARFWKCLWDYFGLKQVKSSKKSSTGAIYKKEKWKMRSHPRPRPHMPQGQRSTCFVDSLTQFFARSLTLVPRSLLRNCTETHATQAI